jgi:hypothetical protein
MYGALPIMPAVSDAGEEKGIDVVALPTGEVCGKLERLKADDINAVLHGTCLAGKQSAHLTLRDLMQQFPVEWARQRLQFGSNGG